MKKLIRSIIEWAYNGRFNDTVEDAVLLAVRDHSNSWDDLITLTIEGRLESISYRNLEQILHSDENLLKIAKKIKEFQIQ